MMTERESQIIKALVRGFKQIVASLEAINQADSTEDTESASKFRGGYENLANMQRRRAKDH
jgi:hypothetical protein